MHKEIEYNTIRNSRLTNQEKEKKMKKRYTSLILAAAISAAALAGLLSLLTSVAGLPEVENA